MDRWEIILLCCLVLVFVIMLFKCKLSCSQRSNYDSDSNECDYLCQYLVSNGSLSDPSQCGQVNQACNSFGMTCGQDSVQQAVISYMEANMTMPDIIKSLNAKDCSNGSDNSDGDIIVPSS